MNICFLLAGLTNIGGIGRVTTILANELVNLENTHMHILSYSNRGNSNFYKLDERIQHDFLFEEHYSATKAILQKNAIIKLRKFLMNNKIDIIIACGAIFFPFVVLSTIGTKIKTLAWEHSNLQNTSDYRFQGKARYFTKHVDGVIALTKKDMEEYSKKYKLKKIFQIYNPVDSSLLQINHPYDLQSKQIISVGRLSYPKNFENLIEVADIVLKNNPEWQWHIYGDGPEYENLVSLVKKKNLQKQLFLKGKSNNLYQLYSSYSLLVMTSRYEGFPMTLLEGMSQGLPLISYDILTGPNEIIENNLNGYLVEPFKVEEMADRIQDLIDSPELRNRISENNKIKILNFSLDNIVQDWVRIFNTIL